MGFYPDHKEPKINTIEDQQAAEVRKINVQSSRYYKG